MMGINAERRNPLSKTLIWLVVAQMTVLQCVPGVVLTAAAQDAAKKADAKPAAKKAEKPAKKADAKAAKVSKKASSDLAGVASVGIRGSNEEVEGTLDAVIPLYRSDDYGLLFFNPRASANDDSEQELNLGLGWRYLFPDQDVIIGANVYYDSRWGRDDIRFDQFGAGLEVLSEHVDARVNYYKPDNDEEVLSQSVETDVQKSTSSAVAGYGAITAPGTVYGEGNSVKQDVQQMVTRRYTTTTTTTRFLMETVAIALEGYDAEIGVKLPLPDDYFETRVFVGYQDFDNPYGDDLDGATGRLEVRALPGLTIDANIYDNDELNNGSDYYVGARLHVPLNLASLAHGDNPFAGAGDNFKKAKKRDFSSRLVEPVIRDLKIQTTEEVRENRAKRDVASTSSSRTATGVETVTHTILSDVQFVNKDNQAGPESGTFEMPWNTIQEGVNNIFGENNVYVFAGTMGAYRENVLITQDGTKLLGEGQAIPALGGAFFGGANTPVINGKVNGIHGPGIHVKQAHDVRISGFDVTRESAGTDPGKTDALGKGNTIDRVGVLAENAHNLLISDVDVYNNSDGILLLADATQAGGVLDYNATLRAINATGNSDDGIDIQGNGASGSFNLVLRDLVASGNSGDGFEADLDTFDRVSLNFEAPLVGPVGGDFSSNGDDGIDIDIDDTPVSMIIFGGDITLNDNSDDGLVIDQAYEDSGSAVASHEVIFEGMVTANDNGWSGIDIEQDIDDTGSAADQTIDFQGSVTANGNGWEGINLDQHIEDGSGDNTIMFGSVTVNDNGEEGLEIEQQIDDDSSGDNIVIVAGAVEANRNGNEGVEIDQDVDDSTGDNLIRFESTLSANDNSEAGLVFLQEVGDGEPGGNELSVTGGVTANGNGLEGIRVDQSIDGAGFTGVLQGENDIQFGSTVVANSNTREGAEIVQSVNDGATGNNSLAIGASATFNSNGRDGLNLSQRAERNGSNSAIIDGDLAASDNGGDGFDSFQRVSDTGSNTLIIRESATADRNAGLGVSSTQRADEGSNSFTVNDGWGSGDSSFSDNLGGDGFNLSQTVDSDGDNSFNVTGWGDVIADNNAGNGLVIDQTTPDGENEAFITVGDGAEISFSGNQDAGLLASQNAVSDGGTANDFALGTSWGGGVTVADNGSSGLDVTQVSTNGGNAAYVFASGTADIAVTGNSGNGIGIDQDATDSGNNQIEITLNDGFGGTSSINVSDNTGDGLQLLQFTDDGDNDVDIRISDATAFFDASRNGGAGLLVDQFVTDAAGDNSVEIQIGGESELRANGTVGVSVVQDGNDNEFLVSDLIRMSANSEEGLNLLQIASDGGDNDAQFGDQLRANNNGADGVLVEQFAENDGGNVFVVGDELHAVNNAGNGVFLDQSVTDSGVNSISVTGLVRAVGNGTNGLLLAQSGDSYENSMFFGGRVVADDNGAIGAEFYQETTLSDSGDNSLTIVGDFGPDGNGAQGIFIEQLSDFGDNLVWVGGDTTASDNGDDGLFIEQFVGHISGGAGGQSNAIVLVGGLSVDRNAGVGAELVQGGGSTSDADNLISIAGDVSANENTSGLVIDQLSGDGWSDTDVNTVVLGGNVTASSNSALRGISILQTGGTSNEVEVTGLVTASANALHGVFIDQYSDFNDNGLAEHGNSVALNGGVVASSNANVGLRILQSSGLGFGGSAALNLVGIQGDTTASGNGSDGVRIDQSEGWGTTENIVDIDGDVTTDRNGANGLRISQAESGWSSVVDNTVTIDGDLNGRQNAINGVLVRQDAGPATSENLFSYTGGGLLQNNATDGLRVRQSGSAARNEATVTGDSFARFTDNGDDGLHITQDSGGAAVVNVVTLENVRARRNDSRGANITSEATGGTTSVSVSDSLFEDNVLQGLRTTLFADTLNSVILDDNEFLTNGGDGYQLNNTGATSGQTSVLAFNQVASGNVGDGIEVRADATVTVLNFGLLVGLDGDNDLFANGGVGLRNSGTGTASAEWNYWGGGAPVGGVDYNVGVTAPTFFEVVPQN